MSAMQQWLLPLETDDAELWMEHALRNHPEPRSVTETMQNITRNPAWQSVPAHYFMPGLSDTLYFLFAFRIWDGYDAATIINEAQPRWEAFLERVNSL
jgi:hypothetical protein